MRTPIRHDLCINLGSNNTQEDMSYCFFFVCEFHPFAVGGIEKWLMWR